MVAYPLNGRPTAFFRGDWYVGKGVACAKIRFGPGQDVAEVFCTHLHAPYEREPNDSYLCHRTAQAWEISKLMRGAAERGHLVVGLGDFNMLPSSFAHDLIVAHSPVKDAWQYLYPDSSLGAAVSAVEKKRGRPTPTASFNVAENGTTCDSAFNSWRWPKDQQKRLHKGENITIPDHTPDPYAKRLDYIFLGDGSCPPSFPKPRWAISHARMSMIERHPTLGCSLSDHFAVEALITRIQDNSDSAVPTTNNNNNDNDNTPQIIPQDATLSKMLTPDTYDLILDMIDKYILRERSQRLWRIAHFFLSVFISIGCFVGVWWSPLPDGHLGYVAFILTFVSTLSFGAGILDGLIGFLFVSSEIRALKEFDWEVKNAKRIAQDLAAVGMREEKIA